MNWKPNPGDIILFTILLTFLLIVGIIQLVHYLHFG